ncbi:helix-turn-helix transcriptional regulator [Nocardia sp. NPDC059091]|uniref:helix-turn-helix transcriptional regulator n=1 Tax=Nocardia sp. NPDC059091 TaxID=3346724 RepID=UPI0036B232E2
MDMGETGISLARFSELIAEINRATGQPGAWTRALRAITDSLDGHHGCLVTAQGGRRYMIASTTEGLLDSYNGHYGRIDPFAAVLESALTAMVLTGSELIPPDGGRRHPFCTGWAAPHELGDGVFARLATPGSWIAVYPRADRNLDRLLAERVLRLFLPHLDHALGIAARLADAVIDRDLALSVLDRHRHGLALVSGCGRVDYANPAALAILGAGDGLRLGALARLESNDPAVSSRLRRLLAAAAQTGSSNAAARLLIPRDRDRLPLTVSILPLCPGSQESPRRAALMVIVDPEREEPGGRETLRELYGLTRAESQVAFEVLRGSGLASVAEELYISVNTARTHLRQVFAKTGTCRQAELVRLLSCVLSGAGQFADGRRAGAGQNANVQLPG